MTTNPLVLIVSATAREASPLMDQLDGRKNILPNLFTGNLNDQPVEIAICGIGTTVTAFNLTRLLSQRIYGCAVSLGIAGAFGDDIAVGEVVQIVEDCFADSGIDDNGKFLSLREAGLTNNEEGIFTGDFVVNPSPALSPYRNVRGITVQTASGSAERINELTDKYRPEAETMENAAFFYVCRMMQIPFVSFRAVSNKVEPRNRNNWQIAQAVERVNAAVTNYILNIQSEK